MRRQPKWLWRILFAVIWAGCWLSWLTLPVPAAYKGSWKIPFFKISIFRTVRAVGIAPYTEGLESFNQSQHKLEMYRLQEELFEDVAKTSLNESTLRQKERLMEYYRGRIFPQYSGESIKKSVLTVQDYTDAEANDRRIEKHGKELERLAAKADDRLSTKGNFIPWGKLVAVYSPPGAAMRNAYYVANWMLYAAAALGLLPFATGLLRFRKRKSKTPRESGLEARRISLIRKPRWGLRLGLALFGPLLVGGVAHTVARYGSGQWQIDQSRNLRLHIEGGCFIVGNFPDFTAREAEIREYYQSHRWSDIYTLPPALKSILLLVKRLQHGCMEARNKGLWIGTNTGRVYIIVAGWGVSLLALPLFLPLLTGLRAEWIMRRRRRQNACARCNYPLDFLPEPRCPECGWRASIS